MTWNNFGSDIYLIKLLPVQILLLVLFPGVYHLILFQSFPSHLSSPTQSLLPPPSASTCHSLPSSEKANWKLSLLTQLTNQPFQTSVSVRIPDSIYYSLRLFRKSVFLFSETINSMEGRDYFFSIPSECSIIPAHK